MDSIIYMFFLINSDFDLVFYIDSHFTTYYFILFGLIFSLLTGCNFCEDGIHLCVITIITVTPSTLQVPSF